MRSCCSLVLRLLARVIRSLFFERGFLGDELFELFVVHIERPERFLVSLGWGPEEQRHECLVILFQFILHIALYLVQLFHSQLSDSLLSEGIPLGIDLESS